MKFFSRWTATKDADMYQSVRSTDDEAYGSKEALLDEASSEHSAIWINSDSSKKDRRRRRLLYGSLLMNAALAIGVAVLSVPKLQQFISDPFNNILIKQVSMPCKSVINNTVPSQPTYNAAPILNKLHIPLRTERRDGSLLPGNPPSLFRQEPSDEVDDAWNRLTNINPIPISAQDVKNIGYDPEIAARWPEEYGLGDDTYVARLDVFHEVSFRTLERYL